MSLVKVNDLDGSSIELYGCCGDDVPHGKGYRVTTPSNMGLLDVVLVDAKHADGAVKWLKKGMDESRVMGLDSESWEGKVVLLQLSFKTRCVVIRMPKGCSYGAELTSLMLDKTISKAGAELFGDALDLILDHKLVVNGLQNLTPHYETAQHKMGLRRMFLAEYGVEWVKDKAITCSNWSNFQLSLHQMKYAALDAWVSYMVGIKANVTPIDLSPWAPNFLARIAAMNRQRGIMEDIQKKEFKMSGEVEVQADGSITVIQDKFSQRVREGYKVIATLPDGKQVKGKVGYVKGKRALLKMLTKITAKPLEIMANNFGDRDKCLEDQSTTICEILTKGKIGSALLQQLFISTPKELFATTFNPELVLKLNHSQQRAVNIAVQNPISAIIGPPGTGKTSTIACIAQCLTTKPNNEVVVIAARQNVAALNVLQALIKRGVKGCLLYVSDDYYVEWHEDDYEQVKDAYVVVGAAIDPLRTWQRYNPGFTHPSVVVCTTGCLASSKALLEVLPKGYSYLTKGN